MVSINHWYAHAEQCALFPLLVGPQFAIMGLDDRVADRQPQTHTVLPARLVGLKQRAGHCLIYSRPSAARRVAMSTCQSEISITENRIMGNKFMAGKGWLKLSREVI